MHLLVTFRLKESLESLMVTYYARPQRLGTFSNPALILRVHKAGQLQAESLALDIMHETHSSISSHLYCSSSKDSSLFCYSKFFIFFVHVDEVTIQDT